MKVSNKSIDLGLVKRVKAGDYQAFDLLVLKYQSRLISTAFKYVKDIQIAEDITQESLIKSFKSINSFREDSSFYTWVYRIAINLAKNFVSSSGYKKSRKSDSLDDTYFEISSQSSLESDILHDNSMQKINSYIKELPESLRTSFVLRESEGKSYEEIAEITNTPVGTVRSRIFRARESVLEYLSKEFLDG